MTILYNYYFFASKVLVRRDSRGLEFTFLVKNTKGRVYHYRINTASDGKVGDGKVGVPGAGAGGWG